MGTEPKLVNPVGDLVNKVISMLVTGVAAPAIEKFAEAEFPPLDWPIVKQIFEHVVENFAGKLSFSMQDGAIVIVVNVQTGSELHSTLSALADLQAAHKAGDPHAIEQARQKAIDSWGNIIHWDGIIPKH
jgi:hypothetical protein